MTSMPLFWEKRVIREGTIEIGSKLSSSAAVPIYIPDAARTAGTLVTGVEAKFQPSR
jgi:hypothetical protein